MDKKTAIEVASKYFKSHTVNELFITSDKQAFFTANDARNHGQSLKETEVIPVKRADAETPVKEEETVEAKIEKATSVVEKTKVALEVAKTNHEQKVAALKEKPTNKTLINAEAAAMAKVTNIEKALEAAQAHLATLSTPA